MLQAQRGITLVELLISTALLVGGVGALLLGMNVTMAHSDYLRDFQIAMNAAEGRLEELAATAADFNTQSIGADFAQARSATGQCRGMGEDQNCNGMLDVVAPSEDVNQNRQLDEPLAGGRLTVQIRTFPVGTPFANANLLDLHVAACWNTRSRQIGEDQNCNGLIDAGEDGATPLNPVADGWVDSPVMVTTRIARRE